MNRNIKSLNRFALAAVGALSLAATQVYAAGSNEFPTPKSRDEVKAELQDARAAGQVPADQPVERFQQNTGAERYVHVRGDEAGSSVLTRAEVLDEVRQIRESGQKLNSDPERSRFRPDTAPVIESPAPVIILTPAPAAEQQPSGSMPQSNAPSAEDVTPDDAPMQPEQAPAEGGWQGY